MAAGRRSVGSAKGEVTRLGIGKGRGRNGKKDEGVGETADREGVKGQLGDMRGSWREEGQGKRGKRKEQLGDDKEKLAAKDIRRGVAVVED